MEIRPYDKNADFATVEQWQIDHKTVPIPAFIMPPTGLIVFDDEEDICAGFIAFSDNNTATLFRMVTNPLTSKQKKTEAYGIIMKATLELILEKGFHYVTLASGHPGIIKRFVAEGFSISEANVTLLGKVI